MLDNQFETTVIGKKSNRPKVVKSEKEVIQARRSGTEVVTDKKGTPSNKVVAVDHQKIAALDRNNEVAPPAKVSADVGAAIVKARAEKSWTQKQLAQAINEKLTVIQDYESGKAIPSNPVTSKLQRALGVKLSGSNIGESLERKGGKSKDPKEKEESKEDDAKPNQPADKEAKKEKKGGESKDPKEKEESKEDAKPKRPTDKEGQKKGANK